MTGQSERPAREYDVPFDPDRRGLSRDLAAALRARIVDGWQEFAGCAGADPEAWFPESPGSAVPPAVVRTCAGCPVRRSCLATSLLWSVEGTWAGTTARDRQDTMQLLKAGAPIAEVITSTLDHAAGRSLRRAVRRRDWFHVDPATLGLTEKQGRQELKRSERSGESGRAA